MPIALVPTTSLSAQGCDAYGRIAESAPRYTHSDMDMATLNDSFGIPGMLTFEDHAGLTRAVVTTPSASATVYLQGAHIAHWQPIGEEAVLFVSGKSAFVKGKAIRGGVPVIFPWFGDRHDGHPGPAHGFARATDWEVVFAAVAGEDLHLTLTLAPSDATRALGFDHFRVAYQLTIGRTLTMQLTVANNAPNDAPSPLLFEEALHTYLAVGDVHRVSVTGLEGTGYIDKRDGNAHKLQTEDPLVLDAATDSVYLDSVATCVVQDESLNRTIEVSKTNSASTIVWNPWVELTAKLADMEADGWTGMICVETANVAKNSITLAPGEAHTMSAVLAVHPLSAPAV